MKRLLEILQLEVQEPTLYGWFHLMWFGILIVLGIKYMMGSTAEKAEYKKTLMPYFIGALLIFGASAFAGVAIDFATNL